MGRCLRGDPPPEHPWLIALLVLLTTLVFVIVVGYLVKKYVLLP